MTTKGNSITNIFSGALIAIGIAFLLLGGTYWYFFSFQKTELFTESSPEGTHKLEFYEKGSPFFVGESKIQVKYEGKRINVPIANDGMNLSEKNVFIRWTDEDTAIISLSGTNQTGSNKITFDADEKKIFTLNESLD